MACYKPLKGYRSPVPNRNGKFGFVFDKAGAAVIPCGRCIGCRIDHSRMWAVRCMHEASLYEKNCFVTLTYNDEKVPAFGSLVKSDLQKFVKRLRKKFGAGIRFYACGEYGEAFGRPHYHLCVFNHDFSDRKLWKVRDGVKLYVSPTLSFVDPDYVPGVVNVDDPLWKGGFATVGDVSFDSAAYVARYVMKKFNNSDDVERDLHYRRLVPETGELVSVCPEFVVMSRRPGVGRPWLDRFSRDVYPSDFCLVEGRKVKVPRYYDKYLESVDNNLYEVIKERRFKRSVNNRPDCTPDRLRVREVVTRAQLSLLKRSI